MKHFSLIALLLVLSVACCFGQEVKPKRDDSKPKPRLKTAPKYKVTRNKSAAKPKVQTTTGQAKPAGEVKPKPTQDNGTKAETTPAKIDSAPTGAQEKPKTQTADAKTNPPKAETKDKPAAQQTKTVRSSKRANARSKTRPKSKTAAEKSQTSEAESKDKTKPQPTAVEPKEKQKTVTPNPPTKTATGETETTTETTPVKTKTAKAPVKNPKPETAPAKTKPETVAVKPKPAAPKTGFQACNLRDAPAIRNLRLGMSRNEADRIIPNERRVNYTNSQTITSYPDGGGASGFENVGQVTAQFERDRLKVLELGYDTNAVRWKNVEEFARNLSDNLKLPHNAWDFRFRKWHRAEMKCKGFSITINSEMNELTLEDFTSSEENARRENGNSNSGDDEGRKTFKP